MAWVYLFFAAIFEMAWTISLRFLSVKKLRAIEWKGFFQASGDWRVVWPLAGYIVFGLANVYCISVAMKGIPMSTALAVWMSTAVVGVKLVEILFLKEPYDYYQFLYIGLIIIGVAGLKRNP